MLNEKTVETIAKLNKKLKTVEQRAHELAKHEHQSILKRVLEKENGICDYELEIVFAFFNGEEEIVLHTEYMKPHFLLDKPKNLNDKQNHNVTSNIFPNQKLNAQKHCWLLHVLYDDLLISWQDIVKIDEVWFDINISLQYKESLK